MTDKTERNRENVLAFLAAYPSWDPAQYGPYLTDDPVYMVGKSVHQGREGFALVAKYGAELYPNGMTREIHHTVAEGDMVSVLLTVRAVTNKGEDYENIYSVLFELTDDGKIARQWEFLDFRYAGEKFLAPTA